MAARLGASVVLTDQAKLLPTLMNNARANAPELECHRWPGHNTSDKCHRGFPTPRPMKCGDVGVSSVVADDACVFANPHANAAPLLSLPSTKNSGGEDAGTESEDANTRRQRDHRRAWCGTGSGADRGFDQVDDKALSRCGCTAVSEGGREGAVGVGAGGRPALASAAGRYFECCSVGVGGGGGSGVGDAIGGCSRGTWRAAELLFSESEEAIWAALEREGPSGVVVGGDDGDDARHIKPDAEQRFDLVVAADIVYLNSLWDAMASTVKVCLC